MSDPSKTPGGFIMLDPQLVNEIKQTLRDQTRYWEVFFLVFMVYAGWNIGAWLAA